MTGNNKNENDGGASTVSDYKTLWIKSSGFFSLYPAKTDTQASDNSDAVLLDIARVGTWDWASEWAASGAKSDVFVYYFTKAPAENEEGGAYHGAEICIPYSDYSNVTWNDTDYKIESVISAYWANFIRTGNPNGDGLIQFPPSSSIYSAMHLGESFGAVPIAASKKRISFLRRWMSTLHQY
ncbi:Carboxylesterase type B [Penicillium antarcticum]|uniref:Carboxylesterase type B n=1 Tax=Penicillium antarcticum TaxID=416450 RepID=UPI00239549E6|nr:Carboxylesterase type B [Penicillium antarcticum]KAJ5298096.1 Carboxylesterase type B [Penicillium antarcticum]